MAWMRASFRAVDAFPDSEGSTEAPATAVGCCGLVRAFLAGIRAAGGQPGFVLKTGTADLNIIAPVWDCPALAYGPGDSTLDHTPNEHLSLEEYQHSVDVLQSVLKRLSSEV